MASLFESFELTAIILDRPEGSLHQARDRQTNAMVLLQRPPASLPLEEGRHKLLRESGVLGQLAGVPGVAQVAGLVHGSSGGALLLKYFPGVSLAEGLKPGWTDPGQLLERCLGLTTLVEGVHRAGFLHRDLHPGAFLIDPSTGHLLLVGFGQASPLAEDRRSDGGPERVSDWGYLAPEQTGRINVPVDRRTDYYALGMVLYALATGEPAFPVQSPLEAIHAHLAKVPPTPRGCPGPLAEILLKLLAKDPDQRYQSLTGLIADLTRCRDQWRQSGTITAFPLGSEDLADQLRPTRKLFGRAQELAVLKEAYERTATGSRETLVIAGPSGSGKTALAAEAGAWALGDQGFFLVGKYDQTRKDQPYSAFVQQVEDLVRHLVRRPDREAWRKTFAQMLGDNQAVVVALEPSFETICGPQPPPPSLPPRETENRLFYTLGTFLRALLSTDCPVVLLFDDIQWIDPASIRLLESLGTEADSGRLLRLYAYRDPEEVVSDGFGAFLARLEATSHHPTLTLGNLDVPTVRTWVEEVLGTAVRDPEVLSKTLVAKTAGSPFFLSRLVQRLHREAILHYDRPARRWDWNSQQLIGLAASENVSDLLVSQIDALPGTARTLLSIAACLGTTVTSADLGPFAPQVPDLVTALWPLIDQQYLIPLSDGYLALAAPEYRQGNAEVRSFSFRFQHDGIRQAARDRLSPEARAEIHLLAARWLEESRPSEAVGHYLTVLDKITTPEATLRLVRLMIKVAMAARASSASHQALDLFRRAQTLAQAALPEAEANQLLLLLAETAYLCHDIDEAEKTSQVLLARLTDPGAKAEVFQMQMDAFTFLGQMTDALERGQRALAALGVKLALSPNPLVLASTLIRVTGKAGRQTPEALFGREGQTPDRIRTLLRLLGKFLVPAQMSGNVNLFVLSTLMTAELALTHPNTEETSGAFGNFAILLSVLGRHRQAYDFASLALRLEGVRPNPKTAAGVHSAYAFFSLPWNRPWSEVPPACRRGAEAAVRAGDLFYIAYQNLFATVFSPSPVLEDSITALQATLQTIAATHQDDAVVGGTFALRRWQALAGTRDNPFDFSGPGFDEKAAVQAWDAKKNLSGLAVYHLYKTQVLFTLGRYEEAAAQWRAGLPAASSIQGSAYMEEYAVFTALVGSKGARAKEAKRLAAWAKTCPENFAALAALADAEVLAFRGRTRAAALRFAEAIHQASPSLHIRWKALIHERAATFHLDGGDRVLGGYLMADAVRLYGLWGAKAKVLQLTQAHQGLGQGVGGSPGSIPTALDGDAASLWKISQAVSREIDVDRLMTVVIQAVIENAGARRGWLLLHGNAGWQVVARGNSEGEAQAFANEVTPDSEGIPDSLLAAAEGSDQGLLVSSALLDPRFSSDPRVTARQVKSVLALRFSPPGSQLRALWYFENDLVEGAFSVDRLGGLRLLSGQIGISLENARMYRALTDLNRDLEGKVRDRTAELEERNRQFLHSVEYAGVLQRSLLPRDWGSSVASQFALWVPKDIVGGDLYWVREAQGETLLAVVDCTGHGVPGALITVLVHSILDEVWASTPVGDLASVLTKVNQQFRRALGQDKPGSESNDGFDIGLLWWSQDGDLKFAGARIPLIAVTPNGVTWYHGGKKGLGYPETPETPAIEVQAVPRVPGAQYFLTSDGFPGQVGGKKKISLGRERFAELLIMAAALAPEARPTALKEAFDAYRGDRPQADDITIVGIELK